MSSGPTLPTELWAKIVELAVYEERVIGLGNCKNGPNEYMVKYSILPIL